MAQNTNLGDARRNKNDEFYTQLTDIEAELRNYTEHFVGKVVYCNCDDPKVSNFYHYFANNFTQLGTKRLITTCYKNQQADLFSRHDSDRAISLELCGDNQLSDGSYLPSEPVVQCLEKDGDFRSQECIEFLRQADIVVTNPPFSLFREYVAQLIEYDKKFIIIGNKNAISYKEIFKLIKEDRIWIGYTSMSKDLLFDLPKAYADELIKTKREGSAYRFVNGVIKGRSQSIWFTNLDHTKRHEELPLYKRYSQEEYPKYDNYDAIEVSKTSDIPMDFKGAIGVPISFLDKYNPKQFEIIWTTDRGGDGMLENLKLPHHRYDAPVLKGNALYKRIIIRNLLPRS